MQTLKKQAGEVSKEFGNPISTDQYDALQREIAETENKLKSLNKQYKNTGGLGQFKAKLGQVGGTLQSVGGAITPVSAAAAGLIGSMVAAVPATEELRTDLSKLDNNARESAVGVDAAREAFKAFNVVSDETDSSVEAVSNLLQAGFTESNLQKAVEGLAGAYLRFPDTLKIESLADSLQETLATGAATGQFGELLDRLGIGADTFSEGLSKCKTEAEKQDYALQVLADNGLMSTYEGWKNNNKELVDYKESQNELQTEISKLAEEIMPIISDVVSGITKIISWFNKLSPASKTIIAVILGIVAVAGPLIMAIGSIAGAIGMLSGAALPIIGIIAGVIAAIIAVIAIIENWDAITQWFKESWEKASAAISEAWDKAVAWIKDSWNKFKESLVQGWEDLKKGISEKMESIKNSVAQAWEDLKESASKTVESIKSFFSGLWQKMLDNEVIGWIVRMVPLLFDNFKRTITGIWDGIKEYASGIWEAIKNAVLAPVIAICDLVTGDFDKLKSDMLNIWTNIKEGISKALDGIKKIIESYFGGIRDSIEIVWSNLRNGALSAWESIKSFVSESIQKIKSTITETFNFLKEWIPNTISSIKEKASELLSKIADGFRSFRDGVVNTVKEIPEKISEAIETVKRTVKEWINSAFEWGSDFVTGLVDGLESGVTKIQDGAKKIGEKIREFLHFSRPDVGPLHDYETWMPDFIDGLVAGIDKNLYKVSGAMKRVTGMMSGDINGGLSQMKEFGAGNINLNNAVNVQIGNKNFDAYIVSVAKNGISNSQTTAARAKGRA